MAHEQLRQLDERQLRPYRADDEPAVLALWARALPRWPVSAGAFRGKATGAEQLVVMAGGALAGDISVARAETRAQLTAILVDPACPRAGLGTELLGQARRNLGDGVKSLSAGSGAGSYFWSGVPEDVPGGWAFLQAHGFERTGEAADLLAGIARFRPPAWVLGRAGGGVRFELAAKGDAAEVIDLQERHFPNWKAFYEHQLTLPVRFWSPALMGRWSGRAGSRAQPSMTSCGGRWFLAPWARSGVRAWTGGASARNRLAMVARACELLSARGTEISIALVRTCRTGTPSSASSAGAATPWPAHGRTEDRKSLPLQTGSRLHR